MINSVTSNAQTAQVQQTQQHQQQNIQTQKKNEPDPQDSVVLSKQASGSTDVNHNSESH
ncbi:MAG: hypothetical protein ABSE57_18535 [Bryobacteraceae bacterium]|jgi:hypothetical protein